MGSFINEYEEITANAGTSYGEPIDCIQKLLVSAQMKISNAGGDTGSITLQVSNVLKPVLTDDADWLTLGTETTTTMTDGTTQLFEGVDLPNRWARIKLTAAGGGGITLATHYCVKGF